MYLVDTNVWLERMLDQERAQEVGEFLALVPAEDLLMSDFSLHSIGVILDRLEQRAVLVRLVDDFFLRGGVGLVSIQPADMIHLVEVMDRFDLDFDDAYQYVAAQQSSAMIISFDKDFDRTEQGRQTPAQVLATRRDQ